MPAPALSNVVTELIAEAVDPTRRLTELRAHQMLLEARKLVKVRDLAAAAYMLMGAVYHKQGRFQDALDCAQKANRLEPHNPRHKSNMAAALLELGRDREALDVLLAIDPKNDMVIVINTAEAFFKVGLVDESTEAFCDALRLTDYSEPSDVFLLAAAAATIGLDSEAVELFARFAAQHEGTVLGERDPLDVFAQASPETLGLLENPHYRALKATLYRAAAFQDVPMDLRPRSIPQPHLAANDESANDAASMEILEATRSGRLKATEETFAEREHG